MTVRRAAILAAFLAACLPATARAGTAWEDGAPFPLARSEVAATVLGGRVIVAGGVVADGTTSRRVDAYDPVEDAWHRLPDLPLGLNHAAAAAWRGRVFVVGGYKADGSRSRVFLILRGGRWRYGPRLPAERTAAGAAVVGSTLVVAGGVGPHGLAHAALVMNLHKGRWRFAPGPTPREHLGVTKWNGYVYVVGGRTAGFASNLKVFERFKPGSGRWQRLPPVPRPRGGTGAAALAGGIVSVGGEATGGTIRQVYRYDIDDRTWRRLPDLPTPRHGLAVAALGGRVYAIGGGVVPGLSVSTANESLALGPR
jgi:non-specific serine/threonine protein kinase